MESPEKVPSNHGRVCPWWLGYFLVSPLRRLFQNPNLLLKPYLDEGMTALDVGSGMGFFTLPMARLVGERGRVIAVDIQPRMIASLNRRARRVGLAIRVESRLCSSASLRIDDLFERVDFALAFAVLHEIPNLKAAMEEICRSLKANGKLLIAEPTTRVSADGFQNTVISAEACGLQRLDSPPIRRSYAALFIKNRGSG
jgi:ubiquinone/menaquinone biosynthesis C-methylase UbiE